MEKSEFHVFMKHFFQKGKILFKQSNGLISVIGGACGVMVIIAGYGHGDMSSNPGPD